MFFLKRTHKVIGMKAPLFIKRDRCTLLGIVAGIACLAWLACQLGANKPWTKGLDGPFMMIVPGMFGALVTFLSKALTGGFKRHQV